MPAKWQKTLDAWTVAQQVTGDPGYQVWDDGVAIVMDHLRQSAYAWLYPHLPADHCSAR